MADHAVPGGMVRRLLGSGRRPVEARGESAATTATAAARGLRPAAATATTARRLCPTTTTARRRIIVVATAATRGSGVIVVATAAAPARMAVIAAAPLARILAASVIVHEPHCVAATRRIQLHRELRVRRQVEPRGLNRHDVRCLHVEGGDAMRGAAPPDHEAHQGNTDGQQ